MTRRKMGLVLAAALCGANGLRAEDGGWGVAAGKYLYTAPQAEAGGGIRGKIRTPSKPLQAALAMPPDDPKRVYRAEVSGERSSEFHFAGLPDGRYDLVLVFDDCFFEGITLHRGDNTLTDADRKVIGAIVSKSEPFYNEKIVRRVEGATGKGQGSARAVCTFFRAKASVDYSWAGGQGAGYHAEHRRAIKLVLLEDVGPGWQVSRTREVFTMMVKPGSGTGNHTYRKRLGLVRVAGEVKDLGELDLAAEEPK